MSKVYFCSDPHINHKNLIKGCSNWNDKSGCRPFKNREEHNRTIINGINSAVGEDDTLYCLGDWSFGGIGSVWWFRKQLNIKDIRFIFGNHDHHIEDNKILNVEPEDLKHINNLGLSSKITKGESQYYINAQDLFTWCKYYHETKIEGYRVVLSHYAFDVWNKRHHGAFHLFGHSHNTLPDRGDRRLDVGFESAYQWLGEWRPFSLQEIRSILHPRENKSLDHHNKSTNE